MVWTKVAKNEKCILCWIHLSVSLMLYLCFQITTFNNHHGLSLTTKLGSSMFFSYSCIFSSSFASIFHSILYYMCTVEVSAMKFCCVSWMCMVNCPYLQLYHSQISNIYLMYAYSTFTPLWPCKYLSLLPQYGSLVHSHTGTSCSHISVSETETSLFQEPL
jgi:hypothetical protein